MRPRHPSAPGLACLHSGPARDAKACRVLLGAHWTWPHAPLPPHPEPPPSPLPDPSPLAVALGIASHYPQHSLSPSPRATGMTLSASYLEHKPPSLLRAFAHSIPPARSPHPTAGLSSQPTPDPPPSLLKESSPILALITLRSFPPWHPSGMSFQCIWGQLLKAYL